MINVTIKAALVFLAIVSLSQAGANADTITFELDPIQLQLPDGFRSVESNLVRFSASRAATMHIVPEIGEGWFFGTRGLAVEANPGFFMDFDVARNVTQPVVWQTTISIRPKVIRLFCGRFSTACLSARQLFS
jgi:hypothetical protein